MKVVVDTNLIFSVILNSNGKIGDLLLNSGRYIDFYSAEYLRYEIRNHYDKLAKISKQSFKKIAEAEYFVLKRLSPLLKNRLRIAFGSHLMI